MFFGLKREFKSFKKEIGLDMIGVVLDLCNNFGGLFD